MVETHMGIAWRGVVARGRAHTSLPRTMHTQCGRISSLSASGAHNSTSVEVATRGVLCGIGAAGCWVHAAVHEMSAGTRCKTPAGVLHSVAAIRPSEHGQRSQGAWQTLIVRVRAMARFILREVRPGCKAPAATSTSVPRSRESASHECAAHACVVTLR